MKLKWANLYYSLYVRNLAPRPDGGNRWTVWEKRVSSSFHHLWFSYYINTQNLYCHTQQNEINCLKNLTMDYQKLFLFYTYMSRKNSSKWSMKPMIIAVVYIFTPWKVLSFPSFPSLFQVPEGRPCSWYSTLGGLRAADRRFFIAVLTKDHAHHFIISVKFYFNTDILYVWKCGESNFMFHNFTHVGNYPSKNNYKEMWARHSRLDGL